MGASSVNSTEIKRLCKIVFYIIVREIIMSDAEVQQPKRLKLSGSDHEEPAEIYSPYYTANLQFILNSVLSKDSVDKSALKVDEICKVQQLEQLEGKAILDISRV